MSVSLLKRLGVRLSGAAMPPDPSRAPLASLNDDHRWGHRPAGDPKANDSRGGKGGGNGGGNRNGDDDGPPELAELWRDFNARLNRLFGRRGDGPYRPNARGVGLSVLVVGAIAGLIWLASGAFIVQEGQAGLVSTFGRYSHTTGAGFNWRWPVPIQSVDIVDTAQVQSAEIGYRNNVRSKQPAEALMLTGDDDIVDLQFSVQYKIKDPVAWTFNNRDQVATLRNAAEAVMREDVGRVRMDDVLYGGRDALAQDARRQIQQMVDRWQLGAEIVGVTMQSAQPPDVVAAAFEDGLRAREDRARQRSEAQAYADDVIPQAKARAARLVQDAEGYRAKAVDEATGAAARFDQVVAEYAKAPAVTRDRMYIDTMQQIYSSTSKVMIDAKSANNTIYLPLDGLLARSTANEAMRSSRSGVMTVPETPAPSAPAPAPVQQAQPQQAQPQQAQPPAQQPAQGTPSQRTRDLRSRDNGRDRESR